MPRPLGPDFHPDATRDALGLVRALYAVERDREAPDPLRIKALTTIGETLGQCMKMGIDHAERPEPLGCRAAVSRSAEATDKLLARGCGTSVAEIVRLAIGRVRGARQAPETDRDRKRVALAARG